VVGLIRALKLGGSVITDKRRPRTAREGLIRELMQRLVGWEGRLILVHGGGSFGHYEARRVGSLEEGVTRVREAMHELVGVMERAAVEAGVRVYALPPAVLLRSVNVVVEVLERGCVPMLYGDVVPAGDGFRIMSGDEILERLAVLRVDRVGFGMDVDGVYPERPGVGEPFKELTPGKARALAERLEGAAGVDVTGGIAEKLRRAARIAEAGVEVLLFDASDPDNVDRFLRGERVGTRVVRRD
jgi:isopentenyl phosphate kinase